MNKKIITIVSIALLLLTLSTFAPVFAYLGAPYDPYYTGTEDYGWSATGPYAEHLLITMYGSPEAEWDAMKLGQIDITDWPLTRAYLNQFTNASGSPPYYTDVAVADYGAALGVRFLDMNNNETRGGAYSMFGDKTPVELTADNPHIPGQIVARGSQARAAMAHLVDRNQINILLGSMFTSMSVHITESPLFTGWRSTTANVFPFDVQKAANCLKSAGYIDNDGDGWIDIPGTNTEIVLEFYVRLDLMRKTLGDWVQARLVGDPGGATPNLRDYGPGIKVNRHDVSGGGAWLSVMCDKVHDMYTSGWSISRDPTIHYGLFHSKFYWHPGDPPNYNYVNDEELDGYMEDSVYTDTVANAKTAVLEAQNRMNDYDAVFNIPIFSEWGNQAFKKTILNTGVNWKGIINAVGYGPRSAASWEDSFLNMQPDGTLPESALPLTIRYGWKEMDMPTSLNPYQYSWVWDADIIFHAYTTLASANPYNPLGNGPGETPPGDFEGLIYGNWSIGSYERLGEPCTNMTFWLKPCLKFHDGTPVTAVDYFYSVQMALYMRVDHPEYGWIGLPAWFDSNVVDITPEFPGDTLGVGVDMPDGPDGLKICVYYNVQSPWAFWWAASGIPVVPKEKWWDVFYPDPTVGVGLDGFAPDPQLIGTGPYKFYPYYIDGPLRDAVHYTPGSHMRMDKNYLYYDARTGDFNVDGTVDGSDFFILLQAWDTTPPSDPRADPNYDGTVDGSDFFILLQNWGNNYSYT